MSGFQRFITYLYKYENDTKQENTGFAKVEIRGSSCRLEVHVRNMMLEQPDCPVYLFARNGEIMQGVLVGEMQIRRGSGDIRYMFEEKDLIPFGVSMDKMEGIFIALSPGLYIASQWKEGEIQEKNLHILEKQNPPSGNNQAKEESGTTQKAMEEQKRMQQPQEKEGQERMQQPQEEEKQERMQQQSQEEQKRMQQQPQEEEGQERMQQPQEEAGQKIAPQPQEEQKKNLKATEIPLEKFLEDSDLESTYQKLRLKLTVFFPFKGEDIECVKIDITDLQELPKKYWYLGKNSFLLHGFFNYRHLIMGEIRGEEKSEYFIGVPGVFQNQERIMAVMFGFPEFHTAEQTEYKTGNFGYWYRIM